MSKRTDSEKTRQPRDERFIRLVLCVDASCGYSFNHRRQSADREMLRHLREKLQDQADHIFVNQYTERRLLREGFFSDEETTRRQEHPALPGNSFLKEAVKEGGTVWAENVSLQGFYHLIGEIDLYRWDKRYPADLSFPETILENYELCEEERFCGYSHDEILYQRYILKTAAQTETDE